MTDQRAMANYTFGFLMLLSGFAGISYEILYGRILGNLVGDQFIVSSSILMTFLLGIGVGSMLAHRLWRWLWAIEAGIGLYGLLVALNQSSLEFVVYHGAEFLAGGLVGSVLICVVILFLPAFLMGCSVPLFAGYLSRMNQSKSSTSFSWVYMVYNGGAALTALLIEFYFIRSMGIQGTVIAFAVVNIIIAIVLKHSFVGVANTLNAAGKSLQLNVALFELPKRVLIALILASMASAVFQLWMLKYSELIFGPFRESFALVLSLILLGITVGSWCVKRFQMGFQSLMWINLLGLFFLMLMASVLPYIYSAIYPLTDDFFWAAILLKWCFLVMLMLLPAVTFGATIPALLSHQGEVSQESGALLFVSSLANVLGFLLMVFVLHQYLDYGVQLLVMVALVILALFVYQKKSLVSWVVMCMFALALSAIYWKQWDEDLLYLSYTNFKDSEKLRDSRKNVQFPDRYKGYQDVFSINWMDGDPYFFINGYISIPLNNPSEKIVGGLSTLFSPNLKNALVLGLGSGATASTVGLFFEKTDVVEINPVVRENLFRMRQWNFDIEQNPRVNIMVDDAIHFVKSTKKKYSLILNTVTTPLYFSSSKLYTKNFFDDITKHLNDGGVYVTWMDSRIGDEGADIILRSLQKSFNHCALSYVKSSYYLLIASNEPLTMHQQDAVLKQPDLRRNLMDKHDVMSAWLPYHLMTRDVFSLIGNAKGNINTADYPALEFEMARLQSTGIPKFKKRLLNQLSAEEIKSAVPELYEDFLGAILLQARDRLGKSSIRRRWDKLLQSDDVYTQKALAELSRRKVRMEVDGKIRSLHAYAYQLIQVGRYEEAVVVLEQVVARDSKFDNAHYNLGVCFERLNMHAKALAAFEKELEVDPDDEDVRYRVARLLVKEGAYKNSLTYLSEHIERNHLRTGKAFFYRSLVYSSLGYKALAEKDMVAALKLSKKEVGLMNSLQTKQQARE
ncbi:MAG: tetratricopeptide repeat protein [Mariprofundaceae bacterium]|nr:tetratricopeptide repeat protein [Mariprofundaceae bacterium]